MKAALKFIMTLAGLVLIAANIGALLLLTRFEGLLRDGLTHQAGQILQAEVHLEAIRMDWSEQALVFKGVSVFNPAGFTDREALRIDSLWVRPNLMTVFAKTPLIDEILLEGSEVHLQLQPATGTNIGAMLNHARAWAEQQSGGEKRTWGRPVSVREIRSEPVSLEILRPENSSSGTSMAVAPFSQVDPAAGKTVSGARVLHLILRSLMKQLTVVDGLEEPVREFLLSEWDLESA